MAYDPFSVVQDSSVWQSSGNFGVARGKDPYLRMGVVKKAYQDPDSGEIRYLVDIRDKSDSIEMNCRMLRRFGGVFNYEDMVYQGYKFTDKPDQVSSFDAKAGDAVLVGFLNGEGRDAIILGGVMHAARTANIDITKGPQYLSEFNGVETSINEVGEYTVTFKGIPTNIAILNNYPNATIPAPTYDTSVGSSFFKMDVTGSLELNDNATSDFQNIRIDKPSGTLTINSGKISLKMTKSSQQVDLNCEILNINSTTSITQKTQQFETDATTSVKIKSPQVAIGTDSVELLQQIIDQLDKISSFLGETGATHTHIGNLAIPTGPPLQAGDYIKLQSDLATIKGKVSSIKGGF